MGKAKTDRLDAQVLARFGEATQLAAYPVPEAIALQLMDVVGRRRQLVEMLVAEKNRLSRASSAIRQDIAEHIKQLQERINTLSEQLQHLMQRSDEWKRKRQLLLSLLPNGSSPISWTRFFPYYNETALLTGGRAVSLSKIEIWTFDSLV